ncbi:osteoclast associated Ig-like receptor [Phyllostomus discolor]|uniref:Osteoclast associated Ig-like receptor n=1 Tax=Phyllostomus discolor TaxID=89673 RepID=A0A7E6CNK6_9CHIR|nr:osteoclast-associated immunoglobulin-like receptor isoform X2 [Phyllostomus discolor]KAF6078913.1 osteoclast associated Ig-like receptor [Phyllostomus discolor]
MALVLILQLLTFWPLCHPGITWTGTQEARGPSTPIYSVPPPSHPKPWLRAQPAAVVSPGVNVTLTCRAPQPARRFVLFKSGQTTPVLSQEVLFRQMAEFSLEEVTEAQAGSYHCRYSSLPWVLGVWSQPSDALELLVTDQLPRPSLVELPAPAGAPGDTVSLRCAGCVRNMSFVLYRVGEAAPLQYLRATEPWADFQLPGARAPGTYTCYYHTLAAPYVLSERSEQLVISLDGSGSLDYTRGNLVRLGLAGLVLFSLATLVVWDWRSWRRAPASV